MSFNPLNDSLVPDIPPSQPATAPNGGKRGKRKRSKWVLGLIMLFFVAGIVGVLIVAGQSLSEHFFSKEPVKNSPWNNSVQQVEGWLKSTLPDQEVKALKWGRVKKTDEYYQVSAEIQTRNKAGGVRVQKWQFTISLKGVVTHAAPLRE